MFTNHIAELLIVLIVLIILILIIGGAYLVVRTTARTAAREYARIRAEEEQRQP